MNFSMEIEALERVKALYEKGYPAQNGLLIAFPSDQKTPIFHATKPDFIDEGVGVELVAWLHSVRGMSKPRIREALMDMVRQLDDEMGE